MASTNKKVAQPRTATTHAGLAVKQLGANDKLVRLTLAHMLFEGQFYVNGQTSATLLQSAVKAADPRFVATLAETARTDYKLRHVPLYLIRELIRNGDATAADIDNVIRRPDEMGELLSLYNKPKRQPLSHQLKKGLRQAFGRFNEYSLAKFDKNSAGYSIRDVMFMVRPKPATPEQEALYKRIADGTMATPDTWETELSAGADKKETFERLMGEKKLGALAFLRNLRNMVQAGISTSVIRAYAETLDVKNVLPFRYIAAARVVPQFEDMLEAMMFRSLQGVEKIKGKTVLMVDVSGSMFGTKVSAKSDLDRFDAAAALAVLCREICEEVEIYSFSNQSKLVAPRRGFALVEAIRNSQSHGGTAMGRSYAEISAKTSFDRIICFTDEQSSDRPAKPKGKGYIINVASYQNGINEDAWTTVTGFSEATLEYIKFVEKL
jgi:hypothetical protein